MSKGRGIWGQWLYMHPICYHECLPAYRQMALVGYSPGSCEELDTTEQVSTQHY